MGDYADDALDRAEAVREERRNARDQERYEAGLRLGEPTCRCEPGDRHPLCDLHGEKTDPACRCWRPGQALEPLEQDPDCPVHGRYVDPYGTDVPEPVDPWLAHYDPFTHGPLNAPRTETSAVG